MVALRIIRDYNTYINVQEHSDHNTQRLKHLRAEGMNNEMKLTHYRITGEVTREDNIQKELGR